MAYTGAPSLPYSKLGIVEDSDTASRAISKDAYVIWKGGNYFAKTDILQGATFVVDTNLTAIPDGVVNGIVDVLNASMPIHFSYEVNESLSNNWGSLHVTPGNSIDISAYGFTKPPFVVATLDPNGTTSWLVVNRVTETAIEYYMAQPNTGTVNGTINVLMYPNE